MLPVVRRNGWLSALPAEPFYSLRAEVDTLFDRFFGGDGASVLTASWSNVPIALWEDEDHFYVEAELPGVAQSDLDVTVHQGNLYIQGERKAEQGRNYLYNNRSYSRFQRVVSLPASVGVEQVKAELTNGILSVTLNKTPESKPKKITLQTK
jgi:HSP20 family protein